MSFKACELLFSTYSKTDHLYSICLVILNQNIPFPIFVNWEEGVLIFPTLAFETLHSVYNQWTRGCSCPVVQVSKMYFTNLKP